MLLTPIHLRLAANSGQINSVPLSLTTTSTSTAGSTTSTTTPITTTSTSTSAPTTTSTSTLDPNSLLIVLSEPSYYLLIHYPETFNQVEALPTKPIRVNFPTHSLIKGDLRLELAPSIGYGINSCYKIEYFSWVKPITPAGIVSTNTRATSKKLREEYWWVPAIDGTRLLNYDQAANFQPRFNQQNSSVLSLTRSVGNLDYLPLDLSIVSYVSLKGALDYSNAGVRLVNNFFNQPAIPLIGLDWSGAATKPNADTTYVLEYAKPLMHAQLLFRNHNNPDVLPSASPPFNSFSPSGYPGYLA